MAIIFPTSVVKPVIDQLAFFVDEAYDQLPETVTANIFNDDMSRLLVENYDYLAGCTQIRSSQYGLIWDGAEVTIYLKANDPDVESTLDEFFQEIIRCKMPNPKDQIVSRAVPTNVPEEEAIGLTNTFQTEVGPVEARSLKFDHVYDLIAITACEKQKEKGLQTECDVLMRPEITLSVMLPMGTANGEAILAGSQIVELDFSESDTCTFQKIIPYAGPVSPEKVPEILSVVKEGFDEPIVNIDTVITLDLIAVYDRVDSTLRVTVVNASLADKTTDLAEELVLKTEQLSYVLLLDRWNPNLRENRFGVLPYSYEQWLELL